MLTNVVVMLIIDCSWVWDEGNKSHDIMLCSGNREAYFHPDYSCGTAAVRGTLALTDGFQYYWEIQMISAVYGTDMVCCSTVVAPFDEQCLFTDLVHLK